MLLGGFLGGGEITKVPRHFNLARSMLKVVRKLPNNAKHMW